MKDSSDATVGERLVERISLTQTLLDDNERLRAEIARLRLTDAEREAVDFAICAVGRDDYFNERVAERLQETLERLKERLK